MAARSAVLVVVLITCAAAGCSSNAGLPSGTAQRSAPATRPPVVAASAKAAPKTGLSQRSSSAPASGVSSAPSHHRYGALVWTHDPGIVTGTLVGPCHARDNGKLPDRRCTPGGADPEVTQSNIDSTICVTGYTARVRPPESQTEAFKFAEAYPAYGIAAGVTSELDHLVPLELGGSNDEANLWPEVGSLPNPKDGVENALHQAVCDGKVGLRAAQRAIAANWLTAEHVLGLTATAPAPNSSSPPAQGGCYPKASSGNCYEPGEFCSSAEHGETGVAGDGKTIKCEPPASGSTWRWVAV